MSDRRRLREALEQIKTLREVNALLIDTVDHATEELAASTMAMQAAELTIQKLRRGGP